MNARELFSPSYKRVSSTSRKDTRVFLSAPLLQGEMDIVDRRVESSGFRSRAEYVRVLIFADLKAAGLIPEEEGG